jgi:signal transduction histidine kinase
VTNVESGERRVGWPLDRAQTWQLAQDAALAAAVGVVAVAEIWVPLPSVMGEGSKPLSTALSLLACLALTVRRLRPLASAVVVLVSWPLVDAVQPTLVLFWGAFVPIVIAVYSVARHASSRGGIVGALVAAGTLLYLDFRVPELQDLGEIVFHWMVVTSAWAIGRMVRERDVRAAESERRAIGAERSSRELALRAVADERARIARELHDVVAHAVSVMVVQAGAAEQVVDEPARVRDALAAIRTTGTDALAEMRRLVGILREAGEEAALRPQPGLGSVTALVDQARAGGLAVDVRIEGETRPLPTGLDLAAYRIVQEALTNVRRHADATCVQVVLRYLDEAVEIVVTDDGRGSADLGPGHGVVGMRERAALYGGRLETESAPGGGLTVRAWLPVQVRVS